MEKVSTIKTIPAQMILLRSIAAVTVVPLRRRGGCAELHGVRKKSKKMQENVKKRQKESNIAKKCFLRFFRVNSEGIFLI